MWSNTPDVWSSFQGSRLGHIPDWNPLQALCIQTCTQHVGYQKYAQLSQGTSLFWKTAHKSAPASCFLWISQNDCGYLELVPVESIFLSQWSPEVQNKADFKVKTSHSSPQIHAGLSVCVCELFLVMSLPVLIMRMRTKTCHPSDSHSKQSIRQQKPTENI